MDKEARMASKLYFTFDPLLAQHVLAPRAWARLNVHLVMKQVTTHGRIPRTDFSGAAALAAFAWFQ